MRKKKKEKENQNFLFDFLNFEKKGYWNSESSFLQIE